MEVILVLLGLGVLYTRGWWRLRHQGRGAQGVARTARLVCYWVGLLLVAVALISPLETLAGQFFFMHMIQHLVLIMLVPPLLTLANPLPFVLWGLPDRARQAAGRGLSRMLHRASPVRKGLRTLTNPGLVWLIYVSLLILWHDPNLYNAALRSEPLHDLEHFSFFLPALAFWWKVTGAGPIIHKQFSRGARIFYVIAAIPPTMLLGIAIAFSREPVYTYYLSVPRPWGISALQDQTIGGIIMWIPGSMMYIIATLILTAIWLKHEERKPALPMSHWSTEEKMAAPGVREGK